MMATNLKRWKGRALNYTTIRFNIQAFMGLVKVKLF
jgi:hypothetical protein